MLVLTPQFEKLPQAGYVFLDTNILLEAAINQPPYVELLAYLTNNLSEDLVTLDLCQWEFLKGSNNQNEWNKKKKFFDLFNISIISSTNLTKHLEKILQVYRLFGRKLSLVDIYLAAVLVQYKNNPKVFMLTTNYHDFPTNLFQRKAIAIIEKSKSITPVVALVLNTSSFQKSQQAF